MDSAPPSRSSPGSRSPRDRSAGFARCGLPARAFATPHDAVPIPIPILILIPTTTPTKPKPKPKPKPTNHAIMNRHPTEPRTPT
jgi:hypothetical protein